MSSRFLASSIAALGGAAVLAAPSPARAESPIRVSPSITLSVSLGQKVAFGLGVDLRVTGIVDLQSCSDSDRHGFGGFVQATWLNFSAWRFAGGMHGGGEVHDQRIAVAGEFGYTFRTKFDEEFPAYHGLHVGALGTFAFTDSFAPTMEMPVRVAVPLSGPVRTPEVIPGLGVRFPSMFGAPNRCIVGRPLRGGDALLLPDVVARGERRVRDARLDRDTRGAIADAWLDDARAECASITAFLALARDLAAAGAPPALVAAALRAAEDEARHTRICAQIAADHAGLALDPVLLDPPAATDADRRDALLRLALEAWLDGCLGEGAAAERAARASVSATDDAARLAQAAIAADERRHAELGWSVLAHCLAAGGSEVRDAIAEAARAPLADPPRSDAERDADPAALRAHGRLAQRDADAAWRDTVTASRRRASALLAPSFV
jgi:hypothetical protein